MAGIEPEADPDLRVCGAHNYITSLLCSMHSRALPRQKQHISATAQSILFETKVPLFTVGPFHSSVANSLQRGP